MWKSFSTLPHPRRRRRELADAGKWLLRKDLLVDLTGIEPVTSSMPWKRAPSCATGPQRDEHPLFCWSMPNTSNAPHVATVVSPLSSGERMFHSPRSAKFAVLTLLLWSGSFTGSASAQAAAPAAG